MARVSGVKRRRAERIRAILEANRSEADAGGNGRATAKPEGIPVPGFPGGEHVSAPRRTSFGDDGGERDPETEWKRRSREWLASSDSSRAPGLFDGDKPRRGGGMLRDLAARFAVAAVLFAAVWGVFRLDEPWAAAPQRLIAQALTEDMDTRAAAEWYRSTFAGSPAFIPIFGQENRPDAGPGLPVVAPVASGEVVRSFAETLAGIEIAGEPGSIVTAAETGRVTHVSGGEAEGYSVVIRHAGKKMTVYGRLKSVSVEPDDWVEAGDRIGVLPDAEDGSRSLLYFAVRIDGKYVDPADVVPLD